MCRGIFTAPDSGRGGAAAGQATPICRDMPSADTNTDADVLSNGMSGATLSSTASSSPSSSSTSSPPAGTPPLPSYLEQEVHSLEQDGQHHHPAVPESSSRTVFFALAGNVAITLLKAVAYWRNGSSAMLAETMHR